MLPRRAVAVLLALVLAAPTALAMSTPPSGPPSPPPGQPATPPPGGSEAAKTTGREQAEQYYARAYEEIGRAKKDLENGKSKDATKKFRKAMETCEQAVALDERYHEAWNLLGYTARKTGDFDKAFKAYERCLDIKPDYAPAREYLGEAWLDKGDAKKAREQLAWLERLGATEELKTLRTRYDGYIAEHPEAAAPAASPAAADSASAAGSKSGS